MSELTLAIISAILPAVLLLCFIDKKDSIQHEPFKEILKAFGMGMLAAIFAGIINTIEIATGIVDCEPSTLLGSMWISFFSAGLNEEALKLLFLWLFLRKCKYFDEHMDGIVYAAAVGMGFATLENLNYVLEGENFWLLTAVGRGLFAVPGHFIFAVMMGYFFSLWHFRKERRYLRLAFFVPFFFHGMYDTVCFYFDSNWVVDILLTILLSIFFVIGSRLIKRHLENDILAATQPEPAAEEPAEPMSMEPEAATADETLEQEAAEDFGTTEMSAETEESQMEQPEEETSPEEEEHVTEDTTEQ